jgi:hypothetical protein
MAEQDCGCNGGDEFAALTVDEEAPVTSPDPRGTKVKRWAGIVAPYGVPTGDKRRFAMGALSTRDLPLPVKWQRADESGHQTSVTVATMDGAGVFSEDHGDPQRWGEWHGPGVYGYGVMLDPDPEQLPRLAEDVAEANLLMSKRVIGPSVDLDDMEFHPLGDQVGELSADTRPEIEVTKGRISAVTLVQIPAFAEARPFAIEEVDAEEYAAGETSIVASGVFRHGDDFTVAADAEWDPLGWLARGRREGAALYHLGDRFLFPVADVVDGRLQIVPGAVADAISVLAYSPERLSVDEGTKQAMREQLTELAARCGLPSPPWERAALVASAATTVGQVYRAADFEDPKLTELTPIKIENGRMFGHLASWKGCHIGFKDRCVTAPRSKTNYAYFHVGEVQTDQGPLAVGKVTLGGGHADTRLGFQAAAEHYDDAGSAVAAVRAGEDRFGIWISGPAIHGQEDKFSSLPLHPLSGDWRRVGGSMELVAALAVNTPGFPVPRVHEAAGRSYALVAAGVLEEYANLSTKGRKASAEKGHALPDGSYPIESVGDLENAIQSYGRAPEQHRAALRRLIMRRAKELNAENKIPESWRGQHSGDYSAEDIARELYAIQRREARAREVAATLAGEFQLLDVAGARERALQAAQAFR